MVRLILKTELRSLFNYWKSLGETKMVLYIILGLLLLLLPLPMIVSVLFSLTLSIDENMLDGYILMVSVASVAVLTLLSLHFIIKDMFLGRSLQLYLSFPISAAELFMAKFAKHVLLYAAPPLLPLGAMVGTALAMRFGQWMLLVDSLIYFSALSIFIVSLSYVLVFTTARILPIRRVSEILSFLGAISFVLVYIVLFIIGDAAAGIVLQLSSMSISFSGFLYDYEALSGILTTLGLISAALLALKGTEFITVRALSRGWEAGARTPRKHGAGGGRVRHPVGSLIWKDLKLTTRNFNEMAALLPYYLMPLLFIYFSASVEDGIGAIGANALLVTAIGGTLIISIFVGAYNTARDAEHFAMLKALPLSGKHIAAAKYGFTLLTTVPAVMTSFAIVWFFSSADAITLLQLMIFITLVSMAAVPVGMYIGSLNPVVSSKNPVRRLDTASNVVITIAIFTVLMFTPIILGLLGDDRASTPQLFTAVGILLVMALLALFMLKKVGARYDAGFQITYKD